MPGQNETVVCRPAAGDESRTKARKVTSGGSSQRHANGFKTKTVQRFANYAKPVSVTLDTYVKRTARLASVERNTVLEAIKSQHKTNFTFRFRSREQR